MEVNKEIDAIRIDLDTIDVKIKTKQAEAFELRKASIRELENIPEKDKNFCLERQGKVIQIVNDEIEELASYKRDLKNLLEEKQFQLKLKELRHQAEVYRKDEEMLFTLVKQASDEFIKLNEQINNIRGIVEAVTRIKAPPDTLTQIMKGLGERISLRSFFETDEALSDLSDNSRWIVEVKEKYQRLLDDFPALDEDVHRLRESLRIRLNTYIDLVRC